MMITHHLHLTAVRKKLVPSSTKKPLYMDPSLNMFRCCRFPVKPVNIQLSDDAVLIQKPARHVPMFLRDKFEQEIIVWKNKVSFLSLTIIKQLNV